MSSSKNPRCFARYNARFTLARRRLCRSSDAPPFDIVVVVPVVDTHRIGVDDPATKPPPLILDIDVDVDIDVDASIITARTARRSAHIRLPSSRASVCGWMDGWTSSPETKIDPELVSPHP